MKLIINNKRTAMLDKCKIIGQVNNPVNLAIRLNLKRTYYPESNKISHYSGIYEHLYFSIKGDRLIIKNSLHKHFHGILS